MDSMTIANQPPVCSFFRASMFQTGKPAQRDRDGAAIAQIEGESILTDMNVLSEKIFDFNS